MDELHFKWEKYSNEQLKNYLNSTLFNDIEKEAMIEILAQRGILKFIKKVELKPINNINQIKKENMKKTEKNIEQNEIEQSIELKPINTEITFFCKKEKVELTGKIIAYAKDKKRGHDYYKIKANNKNYFKRVN